MDDCLQIGITNIKVNSAFHPSVVGRLSTGLTGGCIPLSQLAGVIHYGSITLEMAFHEELPVCTLSTFSITL